MAKTKPTSTDALPELNDTDLTEETKRTYEQVLRDCLAEELWAALKKLDKQFYPVKAGKDGRYQSLITDSRYNQRPDIQSYIEARNEVLNSLQNGTPNYDKVQNYLNKVEAVLKSDAVNAIESNSSDNQIKTLTGTQLAAQHFAMRALQQISIIRNYNVPSIVQNTNILLTMNEAHHATHKKKKSWFRRLIDNVQVFLGVKTKEEINAEAQILNSVQKAAVSVAGRHAVKLFTEPMRQNLKEIKGAGIYEGQVDRNEAVALRTQPKQNAPETQPGVVKTAVKTAAKVGAKAAMQKAGEQLQTVPEVRIMALGHVLEYFAGKDEETRRKNLPQEIRKVFENQAKKIAFDSMHDFVTEMYLAYETIGRMMENHPGIEIDYKALGFGHLETPEFKQMMEKMARAMGYDIEAWQQAHPEWAEKRGKAPLAIHLMVYATPEQKERAFNAFMQGDNDKSIGVHFASTIFQQEHARAQAAPLKEKTANIHYDLLVDKLKQVTEQLQTKERMQKAASKALEKIEPRFYDPDSKTFKSEVMGQLKQTALENMENAMSSFLSEPRKAQREASELTAAFNESMRDEMTKMLQAHYMPQWQADPELDALLRRNPTLWSTIGTQISSWMNWAVGTQPETSAAPVIPTDAQMLSLARTIDRKKVSERARDWEVAGARVDKNGMPRMAKQTMINIIQKKTQDAWRPQAEKTLQSMMQYMGGKAILEQLYTALEAQYKKSSVPQQKEMTPMLMQMRLAIEHEDLSAGIKEMTFDEFKLLFDAVNAGARIRYADKGYANFQEQSDLYMLNQALSALESSYIYPAAALSAYQDIYSTMFDQIETQAVGFTEEIYQACLNKVYAKAGTMMQSMSDGFSQGPVDQFGYFIQESAKRKEMYATHLPSTPEPAQPKQQTWGEAMYSGLSTVAGYAAMPIVYPAKAIAALGYYGYAATTGVAGFTADVVREKMAQKGAEVTDAESFHAALVDSCKELIREQAFDAVIQMAIQLNEVKKLMERGQEHQITDLFEKYGLANADQITAFTNTLAVHLGFESIAAMSIAQEGEIAARRSAFAHLPKTEAEIEQDPFVYLKQAVKAETARIEQAIQKGDLKNAHQYMLYVTSLNNIIGKVELVQRETLAVELLEERIENTLGFDATQQGWWAAAKKAAHDRGTAFVEEKTRQGIASQIQSSIAVAQGFTQGTLNGIQEELTTQLNLLAQAQLKAIDEMKAKLAEIKTPSDIETFFEKYNHQSMFNEAMLATAAEIFASKHQEQMIVAFHDYLSEHKMFSKTSIRENFLQQAINHLEENASPTTKSILAKYILEYNPEMDGRLLHQCKQYNKSITDTLPNPEYTKWQYLSDQDWPKMLEIKQVYLFLDDQLKKTMNQATYLEMEIQETIDGIREKPSPSEHADLQRQYDTLLQKIVQLEQFQQGLRSKVADQYQNADKPAKKIDNETRLTNFLNALDEKMPSIAKAKRELLAQKSNLDALGQPAAVSVQHKEQTAVSAEQPKRKGWPPPVVHRYGNAALEKQSAQAGDKQSLSARSSSNLTMDDQTKSSETTTPEPNVNRPRR